MSDHANIVSVLGRSALLGTLSPVEMQAVAMRTVRKSYAAGEWLFSEGEPCAGLFIVSSGRARIFKTSVGGREQVLAVEGPGSTMAELPVFDGGAYPASAVAIEDTEVAFISRRDFQAFCL